MDMLDHSDDALWTLWGCDAALLKYRFRPEDESISAEDLQRDARQLNPESELEHEDWLNTVSAASVGDYQEGFEFVPNKRSAAGPMGKPKAGGRSAIGLRFSYLPQKVLSLAEGQFAWAIHRAQHKW